MHKLMSKPITRESFEIDDFCEESCIIKERDHTSTFTVNELLYILESVSNITNIDFQINTESGMYIPCTWREPYFVNSGTRALSCKITAIEAIDINDDEDDPDWGYLIIIKTWSSHN